MYNKKLFRKCAICNGNNGIVLDKINFEFELNNPLPLEYDIVCCEKCGFTFADSIANQEEYNNYYKNMNNYSEDTNVKISSVTKSYYNKICEFINDKMAKDSFIIDIGCGSGEILKLLRLNGFINLYGLDPSETSIEKIKNYGINGIVGNVFDDIPKEYVDKFDLVISTAVMEHIFDLNQYIEQLKKFMRKEKKSYVYINVPAVEGFSEFIIQKPNYFNQEHINYFSYNSLNNIMMNHNLVRTDERRFMYFSYEKILFGLFTIIDTPQSIIYDSISKDSIEIYLKEYEKVELRIKNKIHDVLNIKNDVIIWGTGQYAKQILFNNQQLKEKIIYFVDNNVNKLGRKIENKEIYLPDKIKENSNAVILICSMKNSDDILKQINKRGFKNIVYII